MYTYKCSHHIQPLQIKSAVAVEGLKGYIYIEAYKQTHVKQVSMIVTNITFMMKSHQEDHMSGHKSK